MTERITIIAKMKNGSKTSYDWYENTSASEEDCFTEQELAWYVLENISNDDRFEDAVEIEAEEVLLDGSEVINRISCVVRAEE